MKKTIIAVLAAVSVSVSLAGCGGMQGMINDTINNTINSTIDKVLDIGKEALSIEEQYISGDIDGSDAKEQLKNISEDLQSESGENGEESGKNNELIQALIEKFSSSIDEGIDLENTYDALKDAIFQ